MRGVALMVLAAGLVGGPALALAEGDAPQPAVSLQSGQKPSPKSLAPPTVPDSKTLEKDVDEAIGTIEEHERDDKLIRETVRTPSRRPDLDHDVEQGIQSRNAERALRGR